MGELDMGIGGICSTNLLQQPLNWSEAEKEITGNHNTSITLPPTPNFASSFSSLTPTAGRPPLLAPSAPWPHIGYNYQGLTSSGQLPPSTSLTAPPPFSHSSVAPSLAMAAQTGSGQRDFGDAIHSVGSVYSWNTSPASNLRIREIETSLATKCKESMQMIREKQKALVTEPLDRLVAAELSAIQSQLQSLFRHHLDQLENIFSASLLPPPEIHRIQSIQRDTSVEMKQLELYIAELNYLKQSSQTAPKCFVALAIISQPFPKAIKKKSKVSLPNEESTRVKLLTGAKSTIKPAGPVKAELIYEDYHEREGTLQIDTAEIDAHYIATFNNLKFTKSTRLKIARLQFSGQVQFLRDKSSAIVPIQSDSTHPFIILTNESQWENSEKMLLMKDIFKENEVPFCLFANYLQIHYLRSTRQDPSNQHIRPLSINDLNYLGRMSWFVSKKTVNKQEFESFWNWFGKVLRKIRHQQPFGSLWAEGLVYGFISREDSEMILMTEEPGTFLIRFSEHLAGKVALTTVEYNTTTKRNEYKHFILSPQQNEAPTRLMELLETDQRYRYSVMINTEFAPANNKYILGRAYKAKAFERYLTKKEQPSVTLQGFYNVV